jgi:hypothetical protein
MGLVVLGAVLRVEGPEARSKSNFSGEVFGLGRE